MARETKANERMKTIRIYRYDKDDPNWAKRLEEAFNPLAQFTPELWTVDGQSAPMSGFDPAAPPPLGPSRPLAGQSADGKKNCFRTSVNRVIGGEFDDTDVLTLGNYSRLVAAAARDKYMDGGLVGAPWREAVLMAADRLEFEVGEFVAWFCQESADAAEYVASFGPFGPPADRAEVPA